MANDGVDVSNSLKLSLGGAEPLSHSRLQVGQPGHQSVTDPVASTQDNRIAIAEDVQKRQAEEKIRSGPGGEG